MLEMTEFNCCGMGMEHEYRDKDVSEFNCREKGMESEADPAGVKTKILKAILFIVASPKAKSKRKALSLLLC